jgi:hypothetical protein
METRCEGRQGTHSNYPSKTLTQETLQKIFYYNPETGDLIRRSNNKKITTKHGTGGYQVNVRNGDVKLVHRVIWCYMTNEWPPQIDHIDGNPFNNKWCNLRAATNTQNSRNSRKPINNTSGYKGVSYIARLNKYRATIMVNRKSLHLGCFTLAEHAAEAYNIAAKKYFGDFALPNKL